MPEDLTLLYATTNILTDSKPDMTATNKHHLVSSSQSILGLPKATSSALGQNAISRFRFRRNTYKHRLRNSQEDRMFI